jgi:putative spermidine/putrescine transport system substrate-binding protein
MEPISIKRLLGISMAIAFVLCLGTATASIASKEVVYAGAGGSLADVQREVFVKPFAAETGIFVKQLGTSDRLSAIKAMMTSGNTIWDIVEFNSILYGRAAPAGWLEPLDWDKIDPNNVLPAQAKLPYGGAHLNFSFVLAVRTDALPEGKDMTSWADFWDVKNFPGGRSLRDTPVDNLEVALLADGVAIKDLYKVLSTPEGQDRAFAKLDEIKPHIRSWWTKPAQAVQLLSDNEVAFTSSYNGRITPLVKSGVPVKIVWNGSGIKASFVSIVKGAKNKEAAQQYISYVMTNPKRAAQFASQVPYPGLVKGLYDHIDPAVAKEFPTYPDNLRKQYFSDVTFWGKHQDALQERWTDWLLQ